MKVTDQRGLITLGVSDLARARAFYAALGWRAASDDPERSRAVLAEAGAAGATVARSGAPTFWGGYSGVFIDPGGHPWEVAHNPGWQLDADGRRAPPAGRRLKDPADEVQDQHVEWNRPPTRTPCSTSSL